MGGGPGAFMGLGGMLSIQNGENVNKRRPPRELFRLIARCAVPYRGALTVFLMLTVADALITAAFPLIFRAIIDDGILKGADRTIWWLASLAASLAVLDAGLTLWQRWISAKIGEGLVLDIRSKIFAKVLTMPIAFFGRTKTGALISRLTTDVIGVRQAFSDTFSSVVGSFVSVIVIFVAMVVLSWQIALLSITALPIFILSAQWARARLSKTTREYYDLNADMNITMAERFDVAGALLAKLYGNQPSELRTLTQKAQRVRDIGVLQAVYVRVFLMSLLLTATLATTLVYGLGGVLVVSGKFQVGTMVALATYLTRLYAPLTALSNVQLDITTALVAFDRLFELLDLSPMIQQKELAVPVPRGPTTIEFDHVNFSYPTAGESSIASLESAPPPARKPAQQEQVLFDLSFMVLPGEMVAIVGPSGAGKSTIGHLASRLYDVKSGAVRINGIDVRDATLNSIQSTIGVVTQDTHLFHDTLRSNLLYAHPGATEDELAKALKAAQILSLVESLPDGLETVVGNRGYRLSGGQKQRIAIARLLLKAPDVVILDEATAHLDTESELAVRRALKSALHGRTSLVIAHRLSTVKEADLILVISDGHIVERGAHVDLLAANGRYAEIYRSQFQSQASAELPECLGQAQDDQFIFPQAAGISRGRHRRQR